MKIYRIVILSIVFVAAIQGLIANPQKLFASDMIMADQAVEATRYTIEITSSTQAISPILIHSGDSIVWVNQTDGVITLEEKTGFQIFLPIVQSHSQQTTQQSIPSVPTNEFKLSTAVRAWDVQPGERVEIIYNNALVYRVSIVDAFCCQIEIRVED